MHLKILNFNIHKGRGWRKRHASLEPLRNELRALDPDIVFIQESQNDQFEFLAKDNWPYVSYGRNVNLPKRHHGNAILSKFPISFSENINISMGPYERRGVLHCITHPPHLHAQPVHLICVHLGLLQKDRVKQLKMIIDRIASHIPAKEAIVLAGDFNDWRNRVSRILKEKLGIEETFMSHHGKHAKTFPAWAPLLRLDRIYTRGFNTHHAKRLIHGNWRPLSDHVALNAYVELSD